MNWALGLRAGNSNTAHSLTVVISVYWKPCSINQSTTDYWSLLQLILTMMLFSVRACRTAECCVG